MSDSFPSPDDDDAGGADSEFADDPGLSSSGPSSFTSSSDDSVVSSASASFVAASSSFFEFIHRGELRTGEWRADDDPEALKDRNWMLSVEILPEDSAPSLHAPSTEYKARRGHVCLKDGAAAKRPLPNLFIGGVPAPN